MNPNLILLPAACLALWTLLVLLLIPLRRFQAVFSGELKENDFKFGESAKVSATVSIPNRNYMNLLEAPVLFYVWCLATHVSGALTQSMVYLAWAYLALRIMQSVVHLSYNRVLHRLGFFATSNFVLVLCWILLLSKLLASDKLFS